jgi:hypothetical protein
MLRWPTPSWLTSRPPWLKKWLNKPQRKHCPEKPGPVPGFSLRFVP